MQGQCVSDPRASNKNCLYGDDLVTENDIGNILTFTSPLMTCINVMQMLISNGYDPVWFCKSSEVTFGNACCDTCSSISMSFNA